MKRWFIFSNLFHHLSEVGMKVLPTATKGFNFCGLVSAMVLSHWVQHLTYAIWFHAEHGPPRGTLQLSVTQMGQVQLQVDKEFTCPEDTSPGAGDEGLRPAQADSTGRALWSSPPSWSRLPHCLADMNWANVGITMVRVSAPDLLPLHSLVSP